MTTMYKKHVMEVTKESFWKCPIPLQEKLVEWNLAYHDVWKAPSFFCTRPYITDVQYLSGNKLLHMHQAPRFLRNNMELYQIRSTNDWSYFQSNYVHTI